MPPIVTAIAAVLLYQLAAASHTRFDWTFENRFELADATKKVLAELPGTLHMTLYFAGGDPRIRHTRLALETMAAGHDVSVASRDLDRFPDEEDQFGIGSSNSVVLELDDRWALIVAVRIASKRMQQDLRETRGLAYSLGISVGSSSSSTFVGQSFRLCP